MKKIKIKSHNRTSKNTGKISMVKDYDRMSNAEKIKKFVKENKNTDKTNIIKFVYKDLGIKDKSKVKKISNILFNNLNKLSEQKIEKVKPVLDNKIENKESNFKYYFGSKNVDDLLKTKNDIHEGDSFYNQKLNPEEKWKETLKRKGLEIIQIKKQNGFDQVKGKNFNIDLLTVNNNKIKIEKTKMNVSDVFKLIKRGK